MKAPAELLERTEVLDNAFTVLSGAARAEPGVLFIAGEPGLGKTVALKSCCAAGDEAGFSVFRASCSELEQALPFGMLDRLFERSGVNVATGQKAPSGAAASEARVARYTRLLEWLRRPHPAPIVLAVDDLHWADVDSVELLSLLCRRIDGLKVAVFATCRPWPSAALEHARMLEHDHFARTCRLRPLSPEATTTLLARHLGRQPDVALARQAHEACAGNPLLIGELASSLAHGEGRSGLGDKLSERLFLPRFAGVGTSGMLWARAASVLGSRFRSKLAANLSGLAPSDAAEAAEALRASGLLRESPDGTAEFVHPLLRKAIYEDLSPLARRELHSKALTMLLDEGAPASEAAPHAIGGQLREDPRAIAALVDAGREALAAGAVGTAAEQLQAAAALAGASADVSLRSELAEACLLTGKVQLASQTLRELLQQQELSTGERVRAMRLEAHLLMATARYAEAKQRWHQASELAAGTDVALAAETLLDGAFLGFLFEGQREAMATVLEAGRALRRATGRERSLHPSQPAPPPARRLRVVGSAVEGAHDDVADLARPGRPEVPPAQRAQPAVLHAQAYLACIGGDFSALDDLMVAARASLKHPRRRSALGWDAAVGYANLAKISERFDDGQAMFEALLDEAGRQGAALMFWSLAVNHADLLWRLGKLEDARNLLTRAIDATEAAPTRAAFAWVGMAHVSHEQGREQESAQWARRVEEAIAHIGGSPYLRLWLAMFTCRRLLRSGDAALAAQAGEQAWALAERSGIVEPCAVPWHGAAIEAFVSSGRLERGRELVARLGEICRALPCQAPRAVAASGTALLAWQRGEVDQAREGFQRALAHNAAVPMPLAEAETLIAYARFLRRSGEITESRQQLRRALSVLEGTGAGRLQSLAREELSGAGGRRRRARPPEELTPREEMVAELAARGLTNAQIARALYISSKTVDHHLSRTYAKLGITSRRDLILNWRPPAQPG